VADLRGYQGGEWLVQLTGWLVAPAALADGWGDPTAVLQVAVRWFTDHRYEPLAASCRRLLRDAGAPVPRAGRGSSAVPGALRELGVTSREVDVLQLVVAGFTNRQIAQRLVLSPKTVEKHVASLLDKTGLPDRNRLRERYRPVPDGPAASRTD
jgi:DNA-binding CsgD family transcriptional regulator